jgi:3',5'-cyclic AMP phosphodiesterase CpdA
MRTIAQISDLHFGAHEPAIVAHLEQALAEIDPDLVVVSGDLTQRARTEQFVEADALLVVPGNHDVPMHKPLARLLWPLRHYRRIVARDRACYFADQELAVLGLASAHGLTVKDGRLTRVQIRAIGDCFANAPIAAMRILVTHHPMVPLPGDKEGETEPALHGARRALEAVKTADIHIVLAGHHHAHVVGIAGPTLSIDPQVMVVQAGTATSWRRRGTPNSFNVLRIELNAVEITEWTSHGGPFSCPGPPRSRSSVYVRSVGGWAGATPAS